MADLVGSAMREATVALLEGELDRAQGVIRGDEAIDHPHSALDARAVDLIARQQPVAGDLRTLVASLRMSADLERMGDLAVHLAIIAQRRHPERAILGRAPPARRAGASAAWTVFRSPAERLGVGPARTVAAESPLLEVTSSILSASRESPCATPAARGRGIRPRPRIRVRARARR